LCESLSSCARLFKNPNPSSVPSPPALEFSVYQAGDNDWEEYKKAHNKSYKDEEESER
jgi:hypothetical protein